MKKTIIISVLILAAALIVSSIILTQSRIAEAPVVDTTELIGCTMEAKICADGTAVGRTGPQCEFEACPDEVVATTTLVTPPAPGIFSANAVQNFTSNYNAGTRTFTFTANVLKRFFFEANSPVSLHDQDGNLLEMKGAMYTGQEDMYTTPLEYLPLTFSFVLPAGESPDQQFVVRIIQDNPSGNTPLYWGTVVSGKK